MSLYMNNWAGTDWQGRTGIDAMKNDFDITDGDLEGVEILLANYDSGGYDGHAFVLFRKNGKLYETRGSHCSCFGLEGQWEPEETSIDALKHYIANDQYELQGIHFELGAILARLGEETLEGE